MDMQSLIEKSHIGHWMKRSGKTFDDLDKYEKYEYEQTIKLLKITMKQFDMVNSSKKTPGYNSVQRERDGEEPMRHYLSKENQYGLMPELLDKIIDLGLDIGIYYDFGRDGRKRNPIDFVAFCLEPDNHPLGGRGEEAAQKWKEKVNLVNKSFRDLTTQNTSHNDLTMYVELAERIRDVNVEQVSLKRNVNTEIFCIKEEFKLEIERNKAIHDKTILDMGSIRSRIEKQEKKLRNKQRITNLMVTEYKEIQDKTIVDMGNLLSTIEKQQEEINKQTEITDAIRTSIVVESEDTSSLFTDVNKKLVCLKEEFKLEIERNKATQDRLFASNRERWELDRQAMADMGSLLSRIEKQEEKINKQADMTHAIRTSVEALSATETSELFTDVNTEIFCIKEEFKLEIERNKAIQDKHVVDIKSMIICNRIVFGVLIIVYITFEIYKNYNFGSREDVCQVKQITHN